MNTKKFTILTLWASRVTAVVVLSLIFTLPLLLDWYGDLLGYHPPRRDMTGIAISFDLCAAAILLALWNVEKLLQNILRKHVFEAENVRRMRRIAICCGVVAVICLLATFFVLPMLIFAAIMGFLCLAVNVMSCLLDGAVVLREENDLTI